MHPAEARHGDLGMVQAADVVLAFSNSGVSEEIVAILPNLKLIGCAVIALVGTVRNEKICINLEKTDEPPRRQGKNGGIVRWPEGQPGADDFASILPITWRFGVLAVPQQRFSG